MVKTLRITLSLEMTYKMNAFLNFLRQIPLIGKHMPQSLYRARWLKLVAAVVAFVWELNTAFLGKLAYFGIMLFLPTMLYEPADPAATLLHVFVLLTLIGTRLNTAIISDSESAYYAVLLMGMDARSYSLVNFAYSLVKIAIGYLAFGLLFGLLAGVPWWLCLLMPLFTVGAKCAVGMLELRKFRRVGEIYRDTGPEKYIWVLYILLLAAAYILPILEIALPVWVSAVIMVAGILAGIASVKPLIRYPEYRAVHQYLHNHSEEVLVNAGTELKEQSQSAITFTAGKTSSRRGFEYLNELFVSRHRKILWKPAAMAALGLGVLLLSGSAMLYFIPEIRQEMELDVMKLLPCFAFVMYAVNRGTSYTQALFMNCDHSLLTYAFFKERKNILRLFAIRLGQIVKINLLPGVVAAAGLPLLLYASGGTEDPINYAILAVSILSMSVFFSVHYLVLYYLLQPYTAGSQLKNGAYSFVTGGTYVVCYMLIDLDVPPVAFGGLCIAFCVAYCVIACVLVYFLAPRTFRIRS